MNSTITSSAAVAAAFTARTAAPNPSTPAMPITPQEKQARRLFIGNIPIGVDESKLKSFFNSSFVNAGFIGAGEDAIGSIQINREKNYAFLEMQNSELATKGMIFDGISYENQTLKVRRPKDFQLIQNTSVFDQETLQQHYQIMREFGIVSTSVPDSPNKIYMGGIPPALSEEQVKEIICSFGELKAFNLVKDLNTPTGKVYAFFEYIDSDITDKACRELNGKQIGEKTLFVQRAHLGAKNIPPNTSLYAYSDNSLIMNLLNLNIPVSSSLNSSVYFQTYPNFLNPKPTPILLLLNIASFDELLSDEYYNFLVDDIKLEVETFGTVKDIVIPRPHPETNSPTSKQPSGVGKIFVIYENDEASSAAQKALSFRKYNSRCVLTSFYDEELFENGHLDGTPTFNTHLSEETIIEMQNPFDDDEDMNENPPPPPPVSYNEVPPPRL